MYKVIAISFMLLFSACSDTDEIEVLEEGFPQTWKLVQVNAGMSGIVYEEDELPWQERLILNVDNTFNKIRIFENETLTASGQFQFLEVLEEKQLLLEHNEDSQLVENCSGSMEERLLMVSANQLSGGALPCDGPGLFYTRIE